MGVYQLARKDVQEGVEAGEVCRRGIGVSQGDEGGEEEALHGLWVAVVWVPSLVD